MLKHRRDMTLIKARGWWNAGVRGELPCAAPLAPPQRAPRSTARRCVGKQAPALCRAGPQPSLPAKLRPALMLLLPKCVGAGSLDCPCQTSWENKLSRERCSFALEGSKNSRARSIRSSAPGQMLQCARALLALGDLSGTIRKCRNGCRFAAFDDSSRVASFRSVVKRQTDDFTF